MICNKNIYIGYKLKKPFSSDTKNLPKIYGTKPTKFGGLEPFYGWYKQVSGQLKKRHRQKWKS